MSVDAGGPNAATVVRRPADGLMVPPVERAVSISLIVPTYNESDNIVEVLERTREALAAVAFEIIVVDDDSPDGTWRLVHERFGDDPRINVVRRTGQRGLAMAVVRGLSEASNEVCAVMDADLQHPPEKLPELLAAFEPGVDLVIASRYVEGGGVKRWSAPRRLVSRAATALAHLALPPTKGVADPLSGFFAVRRAVVEDGPLVPIGYKILLEIISTCDVEGIVEVPYVFTERERGASKLGVGEYLDFVKHVLTLHWRLQAAS